MVMSRTRKTPDHARHCGGRNTVLVGLAADLSAAVLADLLAIDIVTATRWAGYAKRDWNDYLAARHADADG
jgi:hypothetical protein